jgi:dipeptidyl aminopeptidase/acylaminoacyl peptidase
MQHALFYFIVSALFASTALADNSGERVAETLRARVTTHDLAALTDIDGLSVSPDGNWAAFQTRRADLEANSYRQAWHVVPIGGGATRRIADGGEAALYTVASPRYVHGAVVVSPPAWSPDGQWIVYARQDNGRSQLWRSRIDGRRTEQLTRNDGELHSEGYSAGFRYSADGRKLFFETRLSEQQLQAALVAEGRRGFHFDDRFAPSYSPHPRAPLNARLELFFDTPSDTGGTRTTGLWVLDSATGRERPASTRESEEHAALRAPLRSPGARGTVRGDIIGSADGAMAWSEARDPSLQGHLAPRTLVAQPVGATSPFVCKAAVCTGQFVRVLLWRNGNEVLFVNFADDLMDERVIYAWRPAESAPPRRVLRTRGIFDDVTWDCSIAQNRLICFYEELTRPRRLVAIDLDSGVIETLYDPNPSWEKFDLGPEPQVIDVRPTPSAHAPSYLILPPNYRAGRRVPLVIVTYVCRGFLRGGEGDEYPIFPLAAQGFAVLCHNHLQNDWAMDARNSVELAIQEQRAPGEPFQRRIQMGVDYAVTELDRSGFIDTDRIGLTGLSMGQQTVRWALFNMPRLTTAIGSSASTESVAFTLGTRDTRRFQREVFGIDSQFSPRFKTLSLARNVDKVRAPFLVNVSDQELLDSVETIGALEDGGRAVDVYVYPGEYHIKWQPAHRLAIYNRNIDWMNFWLQGREDANPAKAEEYKRWRLMRTKQCELFKGADAPWYCRR